VKQCERLHGRIAVCLLLAIWLAFAFPAFTGKARFPVDFAGPAPGQVVKPLANPDLGDAFYAVYPWNSYLAGRLGSGHVPLWDPHRFGGVPFAANIATGTFYPPNWLYASGHILLTLTFISLVSLLAATLLAYWFFRRIHLHPYASLAGALVFTFSAFIIKWSTAGPVFGAAMWLPLALGGLETARQGRARRGIFLTAMGLALSLLAGHAQVALMVWFATGLWAFVGIVATGRAGPRSVRAVAGRIRPEVLAFGAAVVLALGLAAVQALPTAQFSGLILRQQTRLDMALATALPPQRVPTLVLPDYLGSPVDHNATGPGINYQETALYAGLVTLPLAALGLLRRPGRAGVFFALLTLMGFLAVLGTPFYRLILSLPGFSHTLFVTRFIFVVDVGLAGLAALGLHSLITEPARRPAAVMLAPVVVLFGVLLVLVVARPGTGLSSSYLTPKGIRALVIVLVGAGLTAAMLKVPSMGEWLAAGLVGVLAFDLWLFGFPYNPYFVPREIYVKSPGEVALASVGGPRPRYADVSTYVISPNGALPYRLYGLEGYDPFVPKRMIELVSVADDQIAKALGNSVGPFKPAAFSSPVMDLLGVNTVVGPGDAPLGITPRIVGSTALYDRPSAFSPAFLTSCWELRPDSTVLGRLGTMTSPEMKATALVDDSALARRQLADPPVGACRNAGDVTVELYQPERVVARAQADVASVLVLTDTWFPGWEVRVDGKRVPMLRVDHALRGVSLPAGSHKVEFDFRPPLVREGGAITALTLLFMMGWSAAGWYERRRRSAPTARGTRPPAGSGVSGSGARPRATTARTAGQVGT